MEVRRCRSLRWLLAVFVLASCQEMRPWREQPPPWTADSIANVGAVRVSARDGSVTVVHEPSMGRDSDGMYVHGEAEFGPMDPHHVVNISLTQIVRLEVRRLDLVPVVVNVVIIAGVLCAVGALLTSDVWVTLEIG